MTKFYKYIEENKDNLQNKEVREAAIDPFV